VVRIRLGEELQGLTVGVDGPWRLSSAAGEVASGTDLEWTEVAFKNGAVVFGRHAAVHGPVELRAEREGGIWLCQRVGNQDRERRYRGVIQILPTGAGVLRVINVLPMETYLAGVLPNELPRTWNLEAYKALAVAARTYALSERNLRGRYDFDLYDSTQSQVYGGCGTETQTSWNAVVATWGVVATYRGEDAKPFLLRTYYHSTCGGMTVPAGSVFGGETPAPLMGGVACNYCRRSPRYRWPDVVLTKQEIGDALKQSGNAELGRIGRIQRVEIAQTTGDGGRAEAIRVTGASGATAIIRAGYWRLLVGAGKIPSTWFNIVDKGDRIVLTGGRGYGHGVGLCQWGAEYLAERGKSGEEIFRYYYPNVELTRAY
jgi:stage II sporulation protein D